MVTLWATGDVITAARLNDYNCQSISIKPSTVGASAITIRDTGDTADKIILREDGSATLADRLYLGATDTYFYRSAAGIIKTGGWLEFTSTYGLRLYDGKWELRGVGTQDFLIKDLVNDADKIYIFAGGDVQVRNSNLDILNGGLEIGGTEVITSGRVLQNIASLAQSLSPDTDDTKTLGTWPTPRWSSVNTMRVKTENINPDIDQDVNVFYNSPDPSVRYFLLGYRAADATTTTRNSSKLGFRGTYWDGAVSQTLISEAQLEVLDTGPTTRFRISVPPTGDMFHLYSTYDCALQATFRPWTDNLFDLGTSSSRWRNGRFAGGVYVGSPVTGAYKGGILSPDGSIEIWRGTSGDPYIDFKTDYTTDYDVRINKTATHDLQFKVGGSGTIVEALRLLASGNVSIGTNELVFGTFGAEDVNLKRDTANVLWTDDAFVSNYACLDWAYLSVNALLTKWGTDWNRKDTARVARLIDMGLDDPPFRFQYADPGVNPIAWETLVDFNKDRIQIYRKLVLNREDDGTNASILFIADKTTGDYWHIPFRTADNDRLWFRFYDAVAGTWHPVLYLMNPARETYAGLVIGGDTYLKRVGANKLQSDGQFNAATFVSNRGGFPQAVLQYDGKILALPKDANATNTLRDSPWIVLRGEYWDGTTSVVRDVNIFHRMLSTTPTSELVFQIAGTDLMKIKDTGEIWTAVTRIASGLSFDSKTVPVEIGIAETDRGYIKIVRGTSGPYATLGFADTGGYDRYHLDLYDTELQIWSRPATSWKKVLVITDTGMKPGADNAQKLGLSTLRFAEGHIVNLYTGDITLDNGMVITEDSRGVIFKSPRGEELLKLDMEGNLYVKGEIKQWN